MTTDPTARRFVRVLVARELVEQLATEGHAIAYPVCCTFGLPANARLIAAQLFDGRTVHLTFEHASFADVPEWLDPPILTPRYEQQQSSAVSAAPSAGRVGVGR